MGAVVGDDGVADPKWKTISWIKFTACLEPILARSLASIHLVNLSTVTSRGGKRSRTHMANGHVMGMVWSSWARTWIYLVKYWHPYMISQSELHHWRPSASKNTTGKTFQTCSWMKHDAHKYPHDSVMRLRFLKVSSRSEIRLLLF
jgi:hypothetical protein